MDIKDIKLQIINAGEKAVRQLIRVAKEEIIKPDPEDELAAFFNLSAASSSSGSGLIIFS